MKYNYSINRLILFIILSVMFQIPATGQQKFSGDAPLARAGSISIQESEFTRRFESIPFLGRSGKDPAGKRLDFLYSLLSEKLWTLDAIEKNMDTLPVITTAIKGFENMFIRDLLYRKEIREKAAYSENELKEAIGRQQTILYVHFLYSPDSSEIARQYALLQKGLPFDSLLAGSDVADMQTSPEKIVYGQMSESIEDTLFSLPAGEFSTPVATPEGWYIFRLTDRKQEIKIARSDVENPDATRAKEVLLARKEQQRYKEFVTGLFSGRKIEMNAAVLKNIAFHIYSFIRLHPRGKSAEEISLTAADLDMVLSSVPGDSLPMIVFRLGAESFTYSRFFNMLFFSGLKLSATDLNSIFLETGKKAKMFLEDEILAQEGRKRGLDKDPAVEYESVQWKENLLFQLNRSRFLESVKVTDEETKSFYESRYKSKTMPEMVNIIEILTESPDEVSNVLSDLNAGADFRELARKYNKRESTKSKSGEYGYTPLFLLPAYQTILSTMQVGEIAGPVQLPEGYALIKLIGRKSGRIDLPAKSYEQVKENIQNSIRAGRAKKLIDRKTVELALKYGIDINAEIFRSLQNGSVNSLIIRRFGFGGSMPAAPLLAPDNDWVEEYFKRRQVTP